jgi:hypothetical protein
VADDQHILARTLQLRSFTRTLAPLLLICRRRRAGHDLCDPCVWRGVRSCIPTSDTFLNPFLLLSSSPVLPSAAAAREMRRAATYAAQPRAAAACEAG